MGTFSKFAIAVVTLNQKAQTVSEVQIGKWFYTCDIPTQIYSNKGWHFENDVKYHLSKMYGVQQLTTTPCNSLGNSICERFNCTLLNLIKTLPKDHKTNWPTYIPSLVFVCNTTPQVTTGYQPHQLMFGRKAVMSGCNGLELLQYDGSQTKSKSSWIQQHHEMIQYVMKRAMQRIKAYNKKSTEHSRGKALPIAKGSFVLLQDQPEGQNNIQGNFKSKQFVIKGLHSDPNVFCITIVNEGQ